MTNWITFWTIMVFTSIAWYAFLLFQIGWQGGCEIKAMIAKLKEKKPPKP